MNKFSTWVFPISVSLLLHIIWILFYSYLNSLTPPVLIRPQVLTVEMLPTPTQQPTATPQKKIRVKEEIRASVKQQPIVEETISETPVGEKTQAVASVVTTTQTINASSTAPEIQPLSKLTRPPAFLNKIEPKYPATEQRSGIQAYVLAEITLDGEGKLLDINIKKSAGKYFDNAVVEAIKQSSFTPGYIEKQGVAVRVLVPFRFKLK